MLTTSVSSHVQSQQYLQKINFSPWNISVSASKLLCSWKESLTRLKIFCMTTRTLCLMGGRRDSILKAASSMKSLAWLRHRQIRLSPVCSRTRASFYTVEYAPYILTCVAEPDWIRFGWVQCCGSTESRSGYNISSESGSPDPDFDDQTMKKNIAENLFISFFDRKLQFTYP